MLIIDWMVERIWKLFPLGVFCLLLSLSLPISSNAGEIRKLPLWQAGITIGGISRPHYPGSNQRYSFPVVFPTFIYRGKLLKASQSGLRGLFYSSRYFAIDIGLSGDLPVYSGDNNARSGMPDIPLVGEMGPRLVVKLYDDDNGFALLGHLPLRAVGGIDGTTSGWTLSPRILAISRGRLPWGLDAFVSASLKYSSKEYNNLYYGVDQQYQTASRPAYEASAGISYYSFAFSTGKWLDKKFSLRLNLDGTTLAGSRVDDSPLVKTRNNISGGIFLTWWPWKSEKVESDTPRVPEPEEEIGM